MVDPEGVSSRQVLKNTFSGKIISLADNIH